MADNALNAELKTKYPTTVDLATNSATYEQIIIKLLEKIEENTRK
jgi:hypothetical protein